eukprot:751092-Hanusia_phi.AAC.1
MAARVDNIPCDLFFEDDLSNSMLSVGICTRLPDSFEDQLKRAGVSGSCYNDLSLGMYHIGSELVNTEENSSDDECFSESFCQNVFASQSGQSQWSEHGSPQHHQYKQPEFADDGAQTDLSCRAHAGKNCGQDKTQMKSSDSSVDDPSTRIASFCYESSGSQDSSKADRSVTLPEVERGDRLATETSKRRHFESIVPDCPFLIDSRKDEDTCSSKKKKISDEKRLRNPSAIEHQSCTDLHQKRKSSKEKTNQAYSQLCILKTSQIENEIQTSSGRRDKSNKEKMIERENNIPKQFERQKCQDNSPKLKRNDFQGLFATINVEHQSQQDRKILNGFTTGGGRRLQ